MGMDSAAGDILLVVTQILVMIMMGADVILDLMQSWGFRTWAEMWNAVQASAAGVPLLPVLLLLKRVIMWFSLKSDDEGASTAPSSAPVKTPSADSAKGAPRPTETTGEQQSANR
eukprot:Hpha_TRINITY_DN4473_c0_g1::TRINITY_DN4473_c0_g1_i1::g.50446::m.50446